MSFPIHFRVAAVLLATFVASSSAAKIETGVVRSVIGEVERQKNGQGDFKPLRVKNKVHSGDYIKTYDECQAIIALPDGSTFSIEEKSLVALSEIMSEDGVNRAVAEVKQGKIRFDVEKQGNSDSYIKFKTGTATAAIRGTKGIFGLNRRNKLIAALHNGKLDIENGKRSFSITGGQAAIPVGDDHVVLDLNGAGDSDFMNMVDSLSSDTTLNQDSLQNKILEMDAAFSEKQNALSEAVKCEFSPLPDTVRENSVSIKGKCSENVLVEINNEKLETSGGEISFTTNWASSAIGEKRFAIICHSEGVTVDCGNLSTYFAGKADSTAADSVSPNAYTPLTITTGSPAVVCDPAAVTIEGVFDASDPLATLYVTLGKFKSPNLVPLSAGGKFSTTINISDKNKNWNETKATVEYNSNALKKSEKASIDIQVNKSCKNVNTIRPTVTVLPNIFKKCKATVSIDNVTDDNVLFRMSIDGTPIKEIAYSKNDRYALELTSGRHQYTFEAEDLAHNKTQVTKEMACYKNESVKLNIAGGNTERLRVPPPPGNIKRTFHKVLRFSISGIPQNDPDYIKRITITQEGKAPVTLQNSDIQSVNFDHQVELPYGKTTQVKIDVVMKSEQILTATKTYEVH